MPNSQDLASVIEAGWTHIIEFNYTKKSGEVQKYRTEVYDVEPNLTYFFGWDLDENKTKKFIIDNISDVRKLEEFVPRFPRK